MSQQPPSIVPPNAPFTPEQAAWLNSFLPSVTADQIMWLSGFIAGYQVNQGGAVVPAAAAPQQVEAAPIPLTILFGSESGNSAALADETKREATKLGFAAKVKDMADYKLADLAKEENILVIVSTWGEGDPPANAEEFHAAFMSDEAPKNVKANFSVCGLGDTAYTDFCEMGKQFDRRLEELGGKRIHARQDCDVDFDHAYKSWVKGAFEHLLKVNAPATTVAPAQVAPQQAVAAPGGVKYDRNNPFESELLENVNLNGSGSETIKASAKETRHIELSLAGSGLVYEPGDALAIIPQNDPEVVQELIKIGGFSKEDVVPLPNGTESSLEDALLNSYDITGLTQVFLKKYANRARIKHLDELFEEGNKDKLQGYLYGREIADALGEFRIEDLTSSELVGLLRKMPPRLYSISSSLKAHPDEVHLTVGAVRYNSHGKLRKGVCSTYLAERVKVGDKIPVYVHHNKNFKLPSNNDTPIIMVGPGTGIAPFRSFIEERAAIGAAGKNWLFFGDQHFATDFLYQLELQEYLASGQLSRLDTAFSRDGDQKVYVQHRMIEQGKQLYAWLQEGAHFYVCGDASRMAKDVHDTLINVVSTHGGMDKETATAYVKQLQKDKRYQRDVY